jgi:hypothetical protein
MNKRFDNKKLFYLLTVLIAILVFTVIIKIPKEKATLRSKIIELDSAEVSRIILYPSISKGDSVEFIRNKNVWTVQQGSIISATQEGAINNIFNEVQNMKPQSLAATNKSEWEEFELTDSLATRIKFMNKKGKILADLMIGKLNYKQPNNPYSGYGGNNFQITSYVRVYNEKEVFAVDGLLPFTINRKFEDWRDKTLVRCNINDVTRIQFKFPADSGYILGKKESEWYIGTQKADSSLVAEFLNSLKLLNGEDFKDNYKPDINPDYQLLAEGNNLLNFSVKCYNIIDADEYILNSSLNPDIYYTSKKNGVFEKLFKSGSYFLGNIGKNR